MGRKTPLMIAILGYSLCNFAAGFSSSFTFLIAIPIAPLYLLSGNFTLIWWAFVLQGAFGSGGFASQAPGDLSERFPTEVRATASGVCYHQGAIWGGLVAPVLA
jgi:MFS transporter, SHS family, lactate transporter